MKGPIRLILIIMALFMMVREFFFGLPLFGGTYILSTGWLPLGTNMSVYLVMLIFVLLLRNRHASDLIYIMILGIIFSAAATVPFLGMILHWILTFMMIYVVFKLIVLPPDRGNTSYYNPGKPGDTVRDYRE